MIDRASTFADPQIIQMLQKHFVPVAFDQWYQRRQQDAEGDFYRRIAGQGPRDDFERTTQGFYIASPDGKLLAYNNNRGPERIKKLMQQALVDYQPTESVAAIELPVADAQLDRRLPENATVVRVNAKVLGGYDPPDETEPGERWAQIFQHAVSRDNLWITADEARELSIGEFSESLKRRVARFHLVDNTRGEPPMWKPHELKNIDIAVDAGGRVTGLVHLETQSGDRGYIAELLGFVETHGDSVVRFDLVAKGQFWGDGRYTPGAPKGKFPLAVAFRLADGTDVADGVAPQGTKGWLADYLGN